MTKAVTGGYRLTCSLDYNQNIDRDFLMVIISFYKLSFQNYIDYILKNMLWMLPMDIRSI